MQKVLSVQHASKHFAGVVALNEVSIEVDAGEVHALLGQNGSGKSTLMKCLSGFYAPDPGWTMTANGTTLDRPLHAGEFRELGMSFVHQDLGLIPSLSITENLRMGVIVAGGLKRVKWREQRRISQALLEEFGLDVDASDPVERLRPVERALVALIRAVDELRQWKAASGREEGGVLFLDEATAVLDREGKNRVADVVRRIVADGSGVVVVSHDLKEMVNVADRITMLRDGSVVSTVSASEFVSTDGIESLIELMTGQRRNDPAAAIGRHATPPGTKVVATIEGLSGKILQDFSANLHEGEILGVTGLVGAGWEEVPAMLFGARKARSGSLTLNNQVLNVPAITPKKAIEEGLGLVPANRQEDGVVPDLSVRANVSLPVLKAFMRRGRLDSGKERQEIHSVLDQYRVVPSDPELDIQALSGGNQQKAVVAKWLNTQPRLLLLQDPTQGVDVGARERIQEIVWAAAREGTAVLYATADYEEIAAIADRVIVIGDGVITDEIIGTDISEDTVAAASLRGASKRKNEKAA